MRIVIDLDGVICPLKKPTESYSDVKLNKDMISNLKRWHDEGHIIIISTARHMLTCKGNVNEVIEKIGDITISWLKNNNVYYDEIYFGKPYGDLYIDDMGITYKNPEQVNTDLQNRMVNYAIPMAGSGSRFLKSGYKIPKYMIKVKNKSLLEWSLESLPLDITNTITFICLEEHKNFKVVEFIEDIIKNKYPFLLNKMNIILIDKVTEGQAETVLAAKKYINNDTPLVVYNIDTYFKSSRLKQKLISAKNQSIDGIIGVFNDNNPKWSFVKTNETGFVTETSEKEPISDIASTGFYMFSKGKDFIEISEYVVKNNLKIKGKL